MRRADIYGDAIRWVDHSSASELSLTGHLSNVNGKDYVSMKNEFAMNHQNGQEIEDDKLLRSSNLQRNIVQTTKNLCTFLTTLKIAAPWKISISLVGINGFRLLADNLDVSPRKHKGDFLHLPVLRVKSASDVSDMTRTGNLLRLQLEYMTRSFGLAYNFCFTDNGIWNIR